MSTTKKTATRSTETTRKPPLRLGILGGANIARQFTRDVAPSARVRVDAVASRSADSAAAFAAAQGIGRWHASYDALLADQEIDAIYLPLPNSLHAEWAIRALEQGKHVLCEKPLATRRRDAQAMFDAARRHRVVLLESYPYWFQPATGALVDLLAEGAIGTVRSVQASFGFTVGNRDTNIRLKPELGGGALLDAGSYPASLIRLVMGDAPRRVQAQSIGDASGVDIATVATMFWHDGRRAQLSCAMDGATHRHATIVGSRGTIETEYLNHTSDRPAGDARGYLVNHLRIRRGIANSVPFEDVPSGTGSGFRFAAEAFARLVAERDFDAVERAAAVSVDIAAMLEAAAESARTARTVELHAP